MLSKEALEEAIPLTEVFDRQDIVLQPVSGSPLESLVEETSVLDGADATLDTEATIAGTAVAEAQLNASRHDLVMDEFIKASADSLRGQISYAKNVVAPKVKEYIDLVEADLSRLPQSGINKFNIRQFQLPEPFASDLFVQTLSTYSDLPYEAYDFTLRLPDADDEKITELLTVGAASIDECVSQWLSRVGADFVHSVYQTVFQVKPNVGEDYSKVLDLRTFMTDKATGNDFAVAVYLLASKLYDNPPEGTDNTLEDYNRKMLLLRNQAGNRLYRLAEEVQYALSQGKLVKNIVSPYEVEVYPQTYSTWLEAGGSNEVLLGSLLSDNSYYTVRALDEDKESLLALWNRNKELEERIAINNKFSLTKDILKNNFAQILLQCELSVEESNTSSKIFAEELGLIREVDLADICAVCLKLICRSLFYKTDSERFLSGMEKVSIENPSMSSRESALISAIELATDFLCAQIKPISAI